MTREQFDEKVKGMMGDVNIYVKKECARLFECGAVNPDDWEDDYLLPKIILIVALENAAGQYKPPTRYLDLKFGKEIENLKHF